MSRTAKSKLLFERADKVSPGGSLSDQLLVALREIKKRPREAMLNVSTRIDLQESHLSTFISSL